MTQAIWLHSLLKFLGFVQDSMTAIHCDNVSANILTCDPSFHARTKHINIQHHYVHEWVEASDLHYTYIPTRENLVDCLTKSLLQPQFHDLMTHLGM